MDFYSPNDVVMRPGNDEDAAMPSCMTSLPTNMPLGIDTGSAMAAAAASIKVEQYLDDFDSGFEPMMRSRANTWHGRAQNVMMRDSGGMGSVVSSTPPPQGSATPSSAGSGGSGLDREGMFSPGGGEDSPGGAGGGAMRKPATRRNAWGNQSYADLITRAIESSPEQRLTLSQIYAWMVQNVPFFTDKGDSNSSAGWKNSIRHNLSLHSRFRRVQNEGAGKSSWWMINPEAKPTRAPRRRAATMDNTQAFDRRRLGRVAKRAAAAAAAGGGSIEVSSPVSSTGSQGSLLSPDRRSNGGFLRSPLSNDDLFPSLSPQDFRPRASSNASSIGPGAAGRLSPIQALPEPIDDVWNTRLGQQQDFSGNMMTGFTANNGSNGFQPMGDTLAETLRDSLSGIFSCDNPYGMDEEEGSGMYQSGMRGPFSSAHQVPQIAVPPPARLAVLDDQMATARHRCLSGGSVTVSREGGNFSGGMPAGYAQNPNVLSPGGRALGLEVAGGQVPRVIKMEGQMQDQSLRQPGQSQNLLKLLQQQQHASQQQQADPQHQLQQLRLQQLQQQQKQTALSGFLDRRMLMKLLQEKPHLKEKIQQLLLEKQQKGLQEQQMKQSGQTPTAVWSQQSQVATNGEGSNPNSSIFFHGSNSVVKNGTTTSNEGPAKLGDGDLSEISGLSGLLPSDLDFDFRPSSDIDCDIDQILRYDNMCFGFQSGTDFEDVVKDHTVGNISSMGGIPTSGVETGRTIDDFSDILT